jgi:hypothetical protein
MSSSASEGLLFFALVINGSLAGAIYALIALAFVLVSMTVGNAAAADPAEMARRYGPDTPVLSGVSGSSVLVAGATTRTWW